jgi:hypothetical protein
VPYVVTFLALLGVLCVFNLVLTVGLVRRVRRDAEPSPGGQGGPVVMRGPGERIGAFRATTLDNEEVSDGMLAGGSTLVGTFGQGCPECHERLPLFVDYARSFPGGRERVLAVVVGNRDEVADELARLRPVARVVLEGRSGVVASALGVRGYPAFAIVDATSTVRASGIRLEHVTGVPVGT